MVIARTRNVQNFLGWLVSWSFLLVGVGLACFAFSMWVAGSVGSAFFELPEEKLSLMNL